jgi:hypothetical protein
MKNSILSLLVALGLIGCDSALADSIPVDQYSKLIIGKWKFSRDTYDFKSDGTFSDTPQYGDSIVYGTWKIQGEKLIMKSGNMNQDPNIKFSSYDECEWEYENNRVFTASRINK